MIARLESCFSELQTKLVCNSEKHDSKIHSHYTCIKSESYCNGLSISERKRQQTFSRKFQHKWLSDAKAYNSDTGIWWLAFVECDEQTGMYCFLCREHRTSNRQNKESQWANEASVRYRTEAIHEHSISTKHKDAVISELMQRVSSFHKQVQERDLFADQILHSAFMAVYWLAKEKIANSKFLSLIQMMEYAGLEQLKYFQHRSSGSAREILMTLGSTLKTDTLSRISDGKYGLMVDEVTDLAVTEHLIQFIQFWDNQTQTVQVKFLGISNLLDESDSANAVTIKSHIVTELDSCGLQHNNLLCLATDGASVMTGVRNGVAKLLKNEVSPHMISIHCVCHRLALACGDANEAVSYVKDVELWLRQLWSYFDNSPKRLAQYLKVQLQLLKIDLSSKAMKRVCRRLKKATRTRWLSLGKSVDSVVKDYVALLQTLRASDRDPMATGLLAKIKTPKFIGCMCIMSQILPHLNELSIYFQRGTMAFSQIAGAIQKCLDALDGVVSSIDTTILTLKEDVSPEGRFSHADIEVTESLEKLLKNFTTKYVDALKINIGKRFDNIVPILNAFCIFDPFRMPVHGSPGFRDYGNKEIGLLSCHFFTEDEDREALQAQWNSFKYNMSNLKDSMPEEIAAAKHPYMTAMDWCLHELVKNPVHKVFSSKLVFLAQVVVCLPVSTAWAERGCSTLKLVMTRLRTRLHQDTLCTLLNIAINGPPVKSKECNILIEKAVEEWKSLKKRKKLPKPSSSVSEMKRPSVSQSKQSEVIMVDAEVQTEAAELEQEVKNATDALHLQDELHSEDSESDSE